MTSNRILIQATELGGHCWGKRVVSPGAGERTDGSRDLEGGWFGSANTLLRPKGNLAPGWLNSWLVNIAPRLWFFHPHQW